MIASTEDKRLKVFRKWIQDAAQELNADLSVRLWNGEIVPMGASVTSPIVLAVNSPDVVRRMVFAPNLLTAVELFAEGLIDVQGGTPLEAAKSYDHLKVVRFGKSLSKLELAKSLWPFVRPGRGTNGIGAYARAVGTKFGRDRNDRDLIRHHYDVGNDFYRCLLGPRMIYSPGYFEKPETDLETAELRKVDLVCRKLRLQQDDHLLDIGCGWGALAIHAAREYGARVLGVTLSEEQYSFAVQRVEEAGLSDRIKIECKDYRDVPANGQFDKVCQIGMSEHLGIDNHDAHFKRVHDLLKPRGLHFHEAITRPATARIKDFRKPTTYRKIITRYIFPGGELDYLGLTCTNMERRRLEVIDVENVREHYMRTCELWVEKLWENRERAVEAAGEATVRLWLFYLSLFAVAFDRGTCSTFQIVASRRRTGSTGLPMQRAGAFG